MTPHVARRRYRWAVGAVATLAIVVVGVVLAPTLAPPSADLANGAQRGTETARAVPTAPEPNDPRNPASETLKTAWVAVDRNAVPPERLPPHQDTYTDSALVRLASDLWDWREGTVVAFDIPHSGARVESVIERVEVLLGTNRTLVGRVTGQDRPRRVVVTWAKGTPSRTSGLPAALTSWSATASSAGS